MLTDTVAAMTYGRPPLERIDLRSLELFEACPPARGSGSRMGTLALDRWKALREATVQWHHDGMPSAAEGVAEIEAAFFAGWDPVQQELLRELFAAYRRLFPDSVGSIDLDPVPGTYIHDLTNRSINVAIQVEVETTDGSQALRIKTGRGVTSPIEAAAFYQADEPRTLVDLRLAGDDIVTVPSLDGGDAVLEDVALRWDSAVSAPRQGRSAGFHCHGCARPARCGQYPVVGGGAVSSRTRTILVSKSRLADFARCIRAATWPALYSIPRDDGEEELDSTNLVVGNQFHGTVAAALLSDDPGALYEAAYSTVSPSEVEDLRWLFDQHEALWAEDSVPIEAVARTEYQFGVTFVVDGVVVGRDGRAGAGDVAVTFMAATDVNGWEGDRVAAVVEHRTGQASSALPHEADLYAVSAWQALVAMEREVEAVAVHFHHLRADPAACDREYYPISRIAEASERLRAVAAAIAGLDPTDALSPSHTVGPWCEWCKWSGRCLPHRS